MKLKKQSKLKRFLNKMRKSRYINRKIILMATGLIVFPVIVALFYKIPIDFVDIPIGDLLSFYAVALGLFATYLTYIEDKRQKSLAKQESLRPKIEMTLELDSDESKTNIKIKNLTDHDYTIVYIGHDYHDENLRSLLNSHSESKIILDCWDDNKPERVYIEVKDDDNNHWFTSFEYQEATNNYCRVAIDPV